MCKVYEHNFVLIGSELSIRIPNVVYNLTSGMQRLDIIVPVTNDDEFNMLEFHGVINCSDDDVAPRIFIDRPVTTVKIIDDDCKLLYIRGQVNVPGNTLQMLHKCIDII